MQFLYVIEFSNGLIKAGRTKNVKSRIKQHSDSADSFGFAVVDSFFELCKASAIVSERLLLQSLSSACTQKNKDEWFSGVTFKDAKELVSKASIGLPENSLDKYLFASGAGSDFAKNIGVSPVLVSQWRCGTRRVPAERCPDIEKVTHGAVRCEDLRPDVDWAVLRTAKRKAA